MILQGEKHENDLPQHTVLYTVTFATLFGLSSKISHSNSVGLIYPFRVIGSRKKLYR